MVLLEMVEVIFIDPVVDMVAHRVTLVVVMVVSWMEVAPIVPFLLNLEDNIDVIGALYNMAYLNRVWLL